MLKKTSFLVFLINVGWLFNLPAQNDKQVLGDAVFTPEELAEGADVMYLIRFQNFGIDTARNIVVKDTLDPRMDAATFQMIEASHDYQLLQDQGFIRWYFNDIRLPSYEENNSESPTSTGYVLFSVQPLPFLEPGQIIQNRACIIFDEQSPLCTNNATIWIDAESGIDEPKESMEREYTIVPNPNYGHFEVRQVNYKPADPDEKTEWWISDMTGKIIWDGSSQNLEAAPSEVMLERPAPGLYMLWLKEKGQLQVEQFAVIR
ncbi:MAG: hypothetical protein R3A50_03955 [Saprospiraceae bacterium]|nr:hypothetical protein [Saprospiraceae bacterium]MCB9343655.1 hypothetical protein [Lewinellaceae bacterium]